MAIRRIGQAGTFNGSYNKSHSGAFAEAAGSGADEARARPASRALVVMDQDRPRRDPAFGRPERSATFLTQLLATRMGLPQTRPRRRAKPAESAARYAATLALTETERLGQRRMRRV